MATKKTTKVNKNMSNNNETKVVCPVCGSEFAIDEHEHTVKNAIAVGKDSGMGTVYLPVSKRGEALQAAGIDTSKYFSINLPTGGTQMMKMGDDGKAVPVTSDDPVIQSILAAGTVPNRSLFRRWVMSQVFHGLMYESRYSTATSTSGRCCSRSCVCRQSSMARTWRTSQPATDGSTGSCA